jgi:hypothetical protein
MRRERLNSAVARGRMVLVLFLLLAHASLAYQLGDQPVQAAALNAVSFAVEVGISLFGGSAVAVLTAGIAALVVMAVGPFAERQVAPTVSAAAAPIQILSPQSNTDVERDVEVRAATRLGGSLFYYAFVSAPGSTSVAGELHVATGGTDVTGSVRLGEAVVGQGLTYTIYVLASQERLALGSSHVPSNAVWSAARVVRRAY